MKASDATEEIELEIELQDDVIMAKVLQPVGAVVAVGEPLAIFCEETEDILWAADLDISSPDSLSIALGSKNISSAMWQAYVKSKKHSVSCG